jgi:hypothetical protein
VLKAHVNGVRCLQANGDRLISGASDKIIFVWSISQAQCELILKGHESGVYLLIRLASFTKKILPGI